MRVMRLLCLMVMFFALPAAKLQAQKTDTLPYMKYSKLPAFNILLTDSSTIFNTFNIEAGKPTAIILFDPDCKHCNWVTNSLIDGMENLSDIQFYFITSAHSMTAIKKFAEEHRLGEFRNVVVGRDYEFFFLTYFGVKYVPDVALYDADKKFIKLVESMFTPQQLHDLTHAQ